MNSAARTAFRQSEIRAMNDEAAAAAAASDEARSDFRRREILELNAAADSGSMAKWGLLLAGVLVIGLMMSRSKR